MSSTGLPSASFGLKATISIRALQAALPACQLLRSALTNFGVRHLLDAVCKEIWELRRSKVVAWTGNYTEFVQLKAEADARQERQYRSKVKMPPGITKNFQ